MKHSGARLCTVAIAVVIGVLLSANVWAARLDMEVQSLKGLEGVHVVVESLDSDITHDGLTTDDLQKTIVQHLTTAGIKLLSVDDLSKSGGAIFYVSVSSVKSKLGVYACSVHAEVIQAAALTRNPDILTAATTWTSGTVGIVGETNVKQINEAVAAMADEFARDYQTANSKATIKPKVA